MCMTQVRLRQACTAGHGNIVYNIYTSCEDYSWIKKCMKTAFFIVNV